MCETVVINAIGLRVAAVASLIRHGSKHALCDLVNFETNDLYDLRPPGLMAWATGMIEASRLF